MVSNKITLSALKKSVLISFLSIFVASAAQAQSTALEPSPEPYSVEKDTKFFKFNPQNKYMKRGPLIFYPDGIIIDKKTCNITIQNDSYSFSERIEPSVFASHLNLSIFKNDTLYKKYSIPSNGELIVQFQTDFFTTKSLCDKFSSIPLYNKDKQ